MLEKLGFLSSLKIFSHLTYVQLVQIASVSRAWSFSEDAVIAWQEEVADKLFIVRNGIINAYHVDNKGNETLRKTYVPGDYFDEVWLFGEDVHDTTLRAVRHGSLYMINQLAFDTFVNKHPEAELKMADAAWSKARKNIEVNLFAKTLSFLDEYNNHPFVLICFRLSICLLLSLLTTIVINIVWPYDNSSPNDITIFVGMFSIIVFAYELYQKEIR